MIAPDLSDLNLRIRAQLVQVGLAQEQGTLPSPVEAVTDLSRDDEESGAGRVLVSVKRALGSKAKDADLAAEATEAAKRNKDQEGDPPPS